MVHLSSVIDVMSIRKNDFDAPALTVQINGESTTMKYRTLKCSVSDENDQTKQFSIKAWAHDFGILNNVKVGDIVSFSRLWKKTENLYPIGRDHLKSDELDVELFVWSGSSALIVTPFNPGEIRDFSIICAAYVDVTIFGTIYGIPEPRIVVINDELANIMEVILPQSHAYTFAFGETWKFIGNLTLEGTLPILHLKKASIVRGRLALGNDIPKSD